MMSISLYLERRAYTEKLLAVVVVLNLNNGKWSNVKKMRGKIYTELNSNRI